MIERHLVLDHLRRDGLEKTPDAIVADMRVGGRRPARVDVARALRSLERDGLVYRTSGHHDEDGDGARHFWGAEPWDGEP